MARQIPDHQRPLFAQLLRRHRKNRGFTQTSLAKATNHAVSMSYIGLLETGDRNASPNAVAALSVALDLSVDETLELLDAAGHLDSAPMVIRTGADGTPQVYVATSALPTEEEEQLLADAARAKDLRISADGVDLEELRHADPEAYDQLMGMARIALDRARQRRTAR
ncbi:MAG: hypothetical protein JWN67_5058 [Actinomycetia bacterium]|nr:hypothetical protein [Actinomycetes bacterium]